MNLTAGGAALSKGAQSAGKAADAIRAAKTGLSPETINLERIAGKYNQVNNTGKDPFLEGFYGNEREAAAAEQRIAAREKAVADEAWDISGSVNAKEVSGKSRVLWSGGKKAMDIAADFATKNGLKILEQTTTGKLLTTSQNVANKIFGKVKAYELLRPLWDNASARFVMGSDGAIHAFLNSQGISDTSVFIRIEYEIAKDRGIQMIFHLVK